MGAFDWDVFLRRWSQAILESMDGSDRQLLPPEVIESGWLGYPGAREADLQRAEIRLGVKLPPSYRAFLQVSNGWRQTAKPGDGSNHRLWSCEALDRFIVRHPQWIKSFGNGQDLTPLSPEDSLDDLDDAWQPVGISDEEYYVYGEDQDPTKLRLEYLPTALEISDVGLDSIYLLNPQVVTAAGEWEAWFLADYLGGADRYPSFQALMEAEYQNFLDGQTPLAEVTSTPKASPKSQPHQTVAAANPATVSMASSPPPPAQDRSPGPTSPPAAPQTDNPLPAGAAAELDPLDPTEEWDTPELDLNQQEMPWQRLKYLAIEVQARSAQTRVEYRTLLRHTDDLNDEVWSGLPDQKVQQWLRRHLKATRKMSLPPSSAPDANAMATAVLPTITADREEKTPSPQPLRVAQSQLSTFPQPPLALELEQLVLKDPARPGNSIVISPATQRQSKSLKLGSLADHQAFVIEVAFRLLGEPLDHPSLDQVFYRVQVFAQNRARSQWLALGETSPTPLTPGRLSYRTTLFNQTLETGMYRLQVLTRFSGAALALASFELPLLNVV
jgi:hypothetical protein